MKARWKILIAIDVVMVVALLASIIHHYQLRAATNAYIAELKAKGEPMDLAQVSPPSVPPEKNSAEAFRQAAALFHDNPTLLTTNYFYSGMKMVAPGKAAIIAKQPDLRDESGTNSWQEFQTAVGENKEAFALLYQIIEKPTFDFGIHYDKGMDNLDFTNLSLAATKAAAFRLGAAALTDLHAGNTADATKNVRAMLAIGNAMRDERLVISELVRLAIVYLAFPETWEILQSTNVTDAQLAALQKDWASLEFFHSMETALETERATSAVTTRQFRSSNSTMWIPKPELSSLDRLRVKSRIFRWRYWWSYPDEVLSLRGDELILDAFRAAQTNDALLSIQNELQSNIAKLSIPTNDNAFFWPSDPMTADLHFTLSESVPALAKPFSRAIKIEIAKRIVIAAIALQRYHLKHGDYPANLAALTPEFISDIPRDPVDGQFLRYQLNSDSTFRLYSIGDDAKDDGGDPTVSGGSASIQWQRGRDWVWPQPATAAEIKKFYDNPPK